MKTTPKYSYFLTSLNAVKILSPIEIIDVKNSNDILIITIKTSSANYNMIKMKLQSVDVLFIDVPSHEQLIIIFDYAIQD